MRAEMSEMQLWMCCCSPGGREGMKIVSLPTQVKTCKQSNVTAFEGHKELVTASTHRFKHDF